LRESFACPFVRRRKKKRDVLGARRLPASRLHRQQSAQYHSNVSDIVRALSSLNITKTKAEDTHRRTSIIALPQVRFQYQRPVEATLYRSCPARQVHLLGPTRSGPSSPHPITLHLPVSRPSLLGVAFPAFDHFTFRHQSAAHRRDASNQIVEKEVRQSANRGALKLLPALPPAGNMGLLDCPVSARSSFWLALSGGMTRAPLSV